MNSITLVGRLATDIETKTVGDKTLAKFRLAVDSRKGEAEFFPIVVWGAQATAVSAYLEKGRLVSLSGRLSHNTWASKTEVKADGTPKMMERYEVVAFEVNFLDFAKREETAPTEEPVADTTLDTVWEPQKEELSLGF